MCRHVLNVITKIYFQNFFEILVVFEILVSILRPSKFKCGGIEMRTYISPESAAHLVEAGSVQAVTAMQIGDGHFVMAIEIDGNEKLLSMSSNPSQPREFRTIETCVRSAARMGIDRVTVSLGVTPPRGGDFQRN